MDEAEIGTARRAIRRAAEPLGFSETELAELEIVVQEIGTNAARYATPEGGCLHWTRPLGEEPGIEIIYWDKGPGIADLKRAVRDGVSDGGGLGGGFGAIRRLTDEFDIYSTVPDVLASRHGQTRRTTCGTALLARKWVAAARQQQQQRHRPEENHIAKRVGVWGRPRPGEDTNGDAYLISRYGESMLYAVIDGLGHGRGAAAASRVALDLLEQWQGEELDEVFGAAHDALRATRGAVMAVCVVNSRRGVMQYAGVGNIDVRVFNAPEPVRAISNNGTLGARFSGLRVWTHPWAEDALIVMSSDGVSATWDIAAYPGLLHKSPQLLAGVLLRDYGRNTDDATVLVARSIRWD